MSATVTAPPELRCLARATVATPLRDGTVANVRLARACGAAVSSGYTTCARHACEEYSHTSLPYVAVYGTLKQGYGNHGRLAHSAESITPGVVAGFTLFGDGIPFARPAPDGYAVVVELVKLCEDDNLAGTMRSLDALEGSPRWYRREPVAVRTLKDDAWVTTWAWMYVGPTNAERYNHLGSTWPANAALE